MKTVLKTLMFCVTLLNIGITTCFGQTNPNETGVLKEKDFTSFDTINANGHDAVVVYKNSSVEFEFDEEVFLMRRINVLERIKIINQKGVERANLIIPISLAGKYEETISDIEAFSYNMFDGKLVKTKLKKENIVREFNNKQFGNVKITIPAVREGTVIEYKFVKTKRGNFNIPQFNFQEEIPVLFAQYKVLLPSILRNVYVFNGDAKDFIINTQTDFVKTDYVPMGKVLIGTKKLIWAMQNIPAYKVEPYMIGSDNSNIHIEFQLFGYYVPNYIPSGEGSFTITSGQYVPLFTDWNTTVANLKKNDYFCYPQNQSIYNKEQIQAVIKDAKDINSKVEAIFTDIGNQIQEESAYYSSIFYSNDIKEISKTKKAFGSELNMILLNALKQADIEAYPAIISTRNNGTIIKDYPIVDRFNKTLVYFYTEDGKGSLIDLGSYPGVLGLLPIEDLNGEALVIKKDTILWIPIVNNMKNVSYNKIDLTFKSDFSYVADINTKVEGYKAKSMSEKAKNKGLNAALASYIVGLADESEIEKAALNDKQKLSKKTFDVNYTVSSSNYVNKVGEKVFISPVLCFGLQENIFSDDSRKYDLDLGCPFTGIAEININLPENYQIESVPKDAKLNFGENEIKFEYLISKTETSIQVLFRLKINRTIYNVSTYKTVKLMFDDIVKKLKEEIILSPKA